MRDVAQSGNERQDHKRLRYLYSHLCVCEGRLRYLLAESWLSWPPKEDNFLHDIFYASVVPELVFSEAASAFWTGWVSSNPLKYALLAESMGAVHRKARFVHHLHTDYTLEFFHQLRSTFHHAECGPLFLFLFACCCIPCCVSRCLWLVVVRVRSVACGIRPGVSGCAVCVVSTPSFSRPFVCQLPIAPSPSCLLVLLY